MSPLRPLLQRHVEEGRGGRIAYVDPELGEVSYAWLLQAARDYAGALAERGVPPGGRGLVVSDDSVAAVVAVLGVWWHGCVPVPVSPMLHASELAFIAKDSGAVFAHLDAGVEKTAELRALLPADAHIDGAALRAAGCVQSATVPPGPPAAFTSSDEVLVQYTSGSTGRPRGVRHSLAGVHAVLDGFGTVLGLGPHDTVLSTAKLSFGYGFGNSLLFPLAAGARTALLSGPVDPHTVAAALRRVQPTVLCAVPRVYAGLLRLAVRPDAVATGSVRLAISAGEHLPAELSGRLAETFGFPLRNGLGATEVLHIVVCTAADRPPGGSTGTAVPGVTITVRDDTGGIAPDGVQGRLHVATPSAALGYLDRPDATARVFADDGVYTGDVVYRTADGDLRYVCRTDDLLTMGGFRVAPAEIETVLRAIAEVADCAVVAEPDGTGLPQAIAYVVAADHADHAELRRAIRARLRACLAPYKRPGRIELLDELPTTSTGKLARYRLRAARGTG